MNSFQSVVYSSDTSSYSYLIRYRYRIAASRVEADEERLHEGRALFRGLDTTRRRVRPVVFQCTFVHSEVVGSTVQEP